MYSVMLVDDCFADILGIRENIDWDALDCQVVAAASNGCEGIQAAKQFDPDIIITDVSMPEMDGIAMTKQLRSTMPDLNFIFISCFDEFQYVKSAMDENVAAYVLKPIKLDELTDAIRKVTHLLDQKHNYKRLESRMKKHSDALIENFLTDLLLHEDFDPEYATLLNIPFQIRFRLALLQIDNDTDISSSEIYSQIADLKNFCWERTDSDCNYFLEYGINSLVLLLHENAMEQTQFKIYLDEIKGYAARAGMNLRIFSDHTPTELSEISKAFHRVSASLKLKSCIPDTSHLYQRLSAALFSSAPAPIAELTEWCFPVDYLEDINYTKAVSVQLINTANLILNEHNCCFSDIFDDEFLVWNKLFHFKTIVNIKQWMTNLLTAIQEYLSNKAVNADKYDVIVTEIKEFINQHYPSPTIVEEVAETVHLSVNHANSIFKNATGQTLFNYTVAKRINRAKELMLDATLSITDIAQAVGYASSAYFATAFKKNTGLTPMQFRNHIAEK